MEHVLNEFSFLNQFILSQLHPLSLLFTNFKSLNNFPFTIFTSNRERIEKTFSDSIFSITIDSHRCPVISSTQKPISHMINGSISSRGSTTQSSCLNNFRPSLLHLRNENISSPSMIDGFMQ